MARLNIRHPDVKKRTEYRMLHYWVEANLGKPRLCSNCGSTDSIGYEWANISGEYKKTLDDWKRLCSSCHRRSHHTGNPNQCILGHPLTPENTYKHPRGSKECRQCRTIYRARHKASQQASPISPSIEEQS